jgi:hypothetical protein
MEARPGSMEYFCSHPNSLTGFPLEGEPTRVAILSIVAILVLFTPIHSVAATTLASNASLTSASYQEQQPQQPQQPTKEFKVDIDIDRGNDARVWYANPIWIAIGGVAFVLFIALIVMASRGSSETTIVKE